MFTPTEALRPLVAEKGADTAQPGIQNNIDNIGKASPPDQAHAWAGRHIVVLNWRDLEHPQAGGAEVFAERIAEQLAADGARVTLFASRPPGLPALTSRHGVLIRRAGGTFGVYAAALRWLATHRRDIDAVVDCQNGIPFFSPLVVRRKTPVVQLIHHVHQRQFGLFFGPLTSAVGRQLEARGARWVYGRRPSVSVSPSTRDEVRTELGLAGPRFLVTNAVDTPAPEALSVRSPTPTIVCVGRLVPHKRIERLLQAIPALAEAIPDLVVHLVGDGPDEARLHEIAAHLDLPPGALVWHGRLPADERDALLAKAWLTVNPTHGEGWGIGVIEAAAFGVPALAFKVPGLRDSIRDGETGWLATEGSPLAPAVLRALETLADPQLALDYRKACLSWASRFTWAGSAALLSVVLEAEERQRQRGSADRRAADDAASVVTLGDLEQDKGLSLRATDLVFEQAGICHALLYGADEAGATSALRRTPSDIEKALQIRPADAEDHLLAVAAGSSFRRVSPLPPPEHQGK